MDKICPMKFGFLNRIDLFLGKDGPKTMRELMLCNKEECAWYCDYGFNKGECSITKLTSLYDALDQISTDVRQK